MPPGDRSTREAPDHAGNAIHIGADVHLSPRQAGWPAVTACDEATTRLSRLCAAVGIAEQRRLFGPDATVGNVLDALTQAIHALHPRGRLVVTFSGHSDTSDAFPDGSRDVGWRLYDGVLWLPDLAAVLSAAPATAQLIAVVDTCYAAALCRFGIPASFVLLASCEENQQVLARPAVGFAERLERLILPGGVRNPHCVSYAWLDRQLRIGTPDVERPVVWSNNPATWQAPPLSFAL